MRSHSSNEHRSHRREPAERRNGLFRTRQIYVRSDGDVQFVTLSPMFQVLSLGGLLGVLFWTAYATVNFAFKDQLLMLREQRISEARLAYEDRVSEMRAVIDRLNDRLLLDQKAYLSRVDAVDTEYRRLAARHEELVRFFRGGVVTSRPADKPEKSSFNDATFGERYVADFSDEHDALQPLAEMTSRLDQLNFQQDELVDGAVARSDALVSEAAGIMGKLGLKADMPKAAPGLQTAAMGGPFIPVALASPSGGGLSERIKAVARKTEDLSVIKRQIEALPIYVPMRNVESISSGFGIRRDPFRRSAAMHAGVDMKAAFNTPVVAVSDGVVNQAGWNGAYGRMVEIIHDNGVATRYAHLRSISVSEGARVKRGDMIGRMGSTGRSTGPHLHYETRVNGRAIDPARFWQAFNDFQTLRSKEKQR